MPLFTWEANDLYLASAKLDNLKSWGATYLTAAVQRTVCKAHGLGSATSTATLVPAGSLEFTLAGVDYLPSLVERALAMSPVLSEEVAVGSDGAVSSLGRLSTPPHHNSTKQ